MSDMLTTEEVANRLKLKPNTLAVWRCHDQGPPYIKVSPRRIRYRLTDIEAWESSRAKGEQKPCK